MENSSDVDRPTEYAASVKIAFCIFLPLQLSHANLFHYLGCPKDWKRLETSCYMSPNVAADWFGAQANCSSYNSHLVTVSSRNENSFLIREFISKQHKSRHFWIGLQRAPFDDSIWFWVDGSRLTFRDWYSGQPDNYRQEEYCGEMYVLYVDTGEVRWNDLNCSRASRFICEKGK